MHSSTRSARNNARRGDSGCCYVATACDASAIGVLLVSVIDVGTAIVSMRLTLAMTAAVVVVALRLLLQQLLLTVNSKLL